MKSIALLFLLLASVASAATFTIFGSGSGTLTVEGAAGNSTFLRKDGSVELTANWDAGPFDIRSMTGAFDSLTSGRVPFASTNGLLIDDGDFTFATDTLLVTKIGAFELVGKLTAGATEIEGSNFDINGGDISAATISGGLTWSAAQDFNNQNLTNVDIDSGTVDGITTLGIANNVDVGNITMTMNGLIFDGTLTDGILSITGGDLITTGTVDTGDILIDDGGQPYQISNQGGNFLVAQSQTSTTAAGLTLRSFDDDGTDAINMRISHNKIRPISGGAGNYQMLYGWSNTVFQCSLFYSGSNPADALPMRFGIKNLDLSLLRFNTDGSLVVNENGVVTSDFRVETVNASDALFIDAGNDEASFGVPVTMNDNLVMDIAGSGMFSQNTAEVLSSTDNLDVTSANIFFFDMTGTTITIGGITGGVEGQVIHLTIETTDTFDFTVEHNAGVGSQDIFLNGKADLVINDDYGGVTLACDGSDWFEPAH